MKKIITVIALATGLIFGLNSCTKTGPAGPALSGSLTGYVTTNDQYGFKVLSDIAGVTVKISDAASDSAVTDATGKYIFPNLKTGVYNITYAKAGYARVSALDYAFVGGGPELRNATISKYPSFSLFNLNDTIETIATEPSVVIRGTDSADQIARTYIVFASSSPTVSSSPGSYAYASTGTLKAGFATWSFTITSRELNEAGLTSGSTAYFAVYPIATSSPTYTDPATGKTVYTAIAPAPSSVLTVTIP